MKSTRRASLVPWLVAAVVAHALTLGIMRALRPVTLPVQTRVVTADALEGTIAVELQAPEAHSEASRGEARVGVRELAFAGRVNEAHDAKSSVSSRRVAALVVPGRELERATPPAGGDAPSAELTLPTASLDQTPAPKPELGGAPTLSLADLGIGKLNAAVIQPYLNAQPLAAAQERLDKNLAQAILDQDRDHSNGIEGPLTRALHTSAMAVVSPDSVAKVAITIGSDGGVADFRIIETNQDARLLGEVGERVKQLIAAQHVRVPNGRAVEFTYELRSEVLLPSGLAPGPGVSLLGIPIKKPRNKKSGKISILEPKIGFATTSLPDPDRNGQVTQTPPQIAIGITVLGLLFDPVDIAAPARQVIHTRLVKQRVL